MKVYVVLLEANDPAADDGLKIQAIYATREAAERHGDAKVRELADDGYIVFGLHGDRVWDYAVVVEEWDVQDG